MASVAQEAGSELVIVKHEGKMLREYLRRNGIIQEAFAKQLEMTPQNLGHHMRKPKLTAAFKRLLKENGIKLFSEIENENKVAENSNDYLTFNFSIKGKRLAKVVLPKDWKKEDIDILLEHLKLMLKSM